MQLDIEVAGRIRRVTVTKGDGDRFVVTVDGHPRPVSVARLDDHSFSLVFGPEIGGGTSYEVTIAPDRVTGARLVFVGTTPVPVSLNGRRGNSRKDGDGLSTASGPQRVVATMPGKVVRVLVGKGDAVRAGQGLVVIEAMKMENELRAARDGTVVDVRVREAMSVDAGAVLVVIE